MNALNKAVDIRVITVVGRFLEHSRIYWFANGGHEEVYLSSADFMPRNLSRRVELCFPIRSGKLQERLKQILEIYLHDTAKSWYQLPDGSYVRPHTATPRPRARSSS